MHEAFNFSALQNLPIFFVCENNLYSVYTHLRERQINSDITRFAKSHKIKNNIINGNDVIEVINQSRKAIEYVRKSSSPYFLQLQTYRWREHCGPNYDNHIGYRSDKEFQKWKKECPVKTYEKFLFSKKLLNEKKKINIEKNLSKTINKSFELAINSKLPNPKTANDFVYHT